MANRWFIDDEVDPLDPEFEDLAPVGRSRKPRKRPAIRADDEDLAPDDERPDKRRKRRWEVPPHKRESDFDPR